MLWSCDIRTVSWYFRGIWLGMEQTAFRRSLHGRICRVSCHLCLWCHKYVDGTLWCAGGRPIQYQADPAHQHSCKFSGFDIGIVLMHLSLGHVLVRWSHRYISSFHPRRMINIYPQGWVLNQSAFAHGWHPRRSLSKGPDQVKALSMSLQVIPLVLIPSRPLSLASPVLPCQRISSRTYLR